MMTSISASIDLAQWEVWAASGAAVASAVPFAYLLALRFRRPAPTPEPGPPPIQESYTTQPDPFDYGSYRERRSSIRRKGKHVEVVVADAGANAVLARGLVLDRSMGGLRVQLPLALKAGTALSVRPLHAGDAVPWVPVTVRTCQGEKGDWEVGCQFARVPAWGVLLHFG